MTTDMGFTRSKRDALAQILDELVSARHDRRADNQLLVAIAKQVAHLTTAVNQSLINEGILMSDMTAEAAAIATLLASVTAEETELGSMQTLLVGLADQIRANAGNPAAILAIADKIVADTAGISAAVLANTPSDPGTSA